MTASPCRLGIFLLGWALVVGCSSQGGGAGSSEMHGLTPEQTDALSVLIVDAVETAHPPADTALAVKVAGPMGERLEARLRQRGYEMAPSSPRLAYRVEPWGDDLVWLAAALPETGWRMDGLYSLNAAGEWVPRSPLAIRNDREGRIPREAEATPVPPAASACATVSFQPGSLRENIARELLECGYRVGEWRLGSDGYIDDWMLQEAYELTVANGVRGLLRALADQYGIDSELRPVAGRVDFMYQREGHQ